VEFERALTLCYTNFVSASNRLRNVTVTLEEEVAQWARMEAARRDTSVSRLLGEILKDRNGIAAGLRTGYASCPWAQALPSAVRAPTSPARRPMTAPVFVDSNVLLYALDRTDLVNTGGSPNLAGGAMEGPSRAASVFRFLLNSMSMRFVSCRRHANRYEPKYAICWRGTL